MNRFRKNDRFEFRPREKQPEPPPSHKDTENELELEIIGRTVPIPEATSHETFTNLRDVRSARKKQLAQNVNKDRNDQLRQKVIETLQLNIVLLQDYATRNSIPESVDLPANASMGLNYKTIQSPDYRNYLIRKHIQTSQDLLFEVIELPKEKFNSFFRHKIMDQTKSIRRLLSFLNHLNA